MAKLVYILIILSFVVQNESARILAVFPLPLISYRNVHRSIFNELIQRNHEIVLITALPEYSTGSSPENLMEIDVSNVTKEIWEETYTQDIYSKDKNINGNLKELLQVAAKIVEKQFHVPEVKSFINNNETFDLLLLDGWISPTLFWTYVYDVPVITVGGLGSERPMVFPTSFLDEVHNLNVWQKMVALYDYWKLDSMLKTLEQEENKMAKRLFGEVSPLNKQMEKIEMVLLNLNPVLHGVRPMPTNFIQLGGIHLQDSNRKIEITEELKEYLDSRFNGVVYVNLGADARPGLIPEQTQRKFLQAFSMLSYPVLWKWDDEIEELPHNVRVGKWFPHAELLKHPNIRLFISRCDQQSIDDAIAAAVPLLALPQAGKQLRNAEQLLRHNIGTVIDMEKVGHEELSNIITLTMRNESYRTNMMRLRTLLSDTPALAPERAANAVEYVLRHTAGHIASPTLHINWYQYMEIELFFIVIMILCSCTCVFYTVMYYIFKKVIRNIQARRVTDGHSFKRFL